MRLFASLAKVDDNEDGTLTVSGIASTEAVDLVGEVVKADAIEAALPDFMRLGTGALREMHQPLAAGTVDSAQIEDGQTLITATVVDPVAIKKVQTGVYKGFSIGGKVLARDPTNRKLITKIRLTEISLVDAPCNPEAVLDLYRADGMDEDQTDMTQPNPGDAAAATPPSQEEGNAGAETAAKAAETGQDGQEAPGAATPGPGQTETPAMDDPGGNGEASAAEPTPLQRVEASLAALDAALPQAEELGKGLYSVSRFAEVLQSLAYLCESCESEAEYEKDGSPVPAKFRSWLAQGAAIFKEMAIEEINELVASLNAAKAAKAAALGGAGDEIVVKLSTEAGGVAEALAKAAADLKTVAAERDAALAKVEEQDSALTKVAGQIEAITSRLAKLEAEPAPAKTAGSSAQVVTKAQDAAGHAAAPSTIELSAEAIQKALDAMDPQERALTLTKAALAMPRAVATRG